MLRLLGFYLVEDMDSWGAKNEGLSLFLKFKWLPQGMFWLVDGVNRPHKVTHLLRTVFTPSWFFELEQSGGRDSLDLLTKVKYKERGGEEEEWRVLESVVNYWLLAIYNQFF